MISAARCVRRYVPAVNRLYVGVAVASTLAADHFSIKHSVSNHFLNCKLAAKSL